MTRLTACISSFFLLCCASLAQSPAPAVSPVANGVATAESPEIREFQKIEDSWSTAINSRDQYGLELVLSPLFVDISATGDIGTRNQQVAQVINGEDKTIHLEQRVITVRMLGDVAVASGTYALRHRVGSSEATDRGIFTQVFQRNHGGWLCVNSQRTLLREDANGKQQKKQSTAEMPFHIPLFSRNDKSNQ